MVQPGCALLSNPFLSETRAANLALGRHPRILAIKATV
jgi:hypothetical protein